MSKYLIIATLLFSCVTLYLIFSFLWTPNEDVCDAVGEKSPKNDDDGTRTVLSTDTKVNKNKTTKSKHQQSADARHRARSADQFRHAIPAPCADEVCNRRRLDAVKSRPL